MRGARAGFAGSRRGGKLLTHRLWALTRPGGAVSLPGELGLPGCAHGIRVGKQHVEAIVGDVDHL